MGQFGQFILYVQDTSDCSNETATQPDFYEGSADVDKILVLYNFFRILSA